MMGSRWMEKMGAVQHGRLIITPDGNAKEEELAHDALIFSHLLT